MIDLKKEKNIVEELYLALQILLLLYLLNRAFPLLTEKTGHLMPYFALSYALYIVYRVWSYFFSVRSVHMFISGILDALFVMTYLLLKKSGWGGEENIIFAYVTIQALRFPSKNSMVFVFIAIAMDGILNYSRAQGQVFWNAFLSDAFLIIFVSVCIAVALKQIFTLQKDKDFYYSALKEKNKELDLLASTDFLTGLYNHKSFYLRLNKLKTCCKSANEPISMALIDIDNFKKINDTHGHLAGDEILKGLSALLRDSVRRSDFVARYGGEEFVILFPNTPLEVGVTLCERLCEKVAQTEFRVDGVLIPLTVSIGVGSAYAGAVGDIPLFVKSVDTLLYEAKHTGKNKVVYEPVL